MKKREQGFSLIELMIVIAIIAILASIALPQFRRQQARAAENACLAEMKSYASFVIAAVVNETTLPTAPLKACAAADIATADSTTITGTPKAPGTRLSTCNMSSATCSLDP